MKKIDLVFLGVSLLVFLWPGSGRAQIAGAGYPTSMNPGFPCPVFAKPCKDNYGLAGAADDQILGSVRQPLRTTSAHQPEKQSLKEEVVQVPVLEPEEVTITDKIHPAIKYDATDLHAAQAIGEEDPGLIAPLTMDFSIPIANLQDQCGAVLQPGSFQVGYNFWNKAKVYGKKNNGKLESFTVSILPKATTPMSTQAAAAGVQKTWHPQLRYVTTLFPKMGRGPVETHYARYTLPKEAAEYFQAGNTLVLHAEGFDNIYLGVWCSVVRQSR